MIFALIPAAGHSRRMGRPKLLLPFGGATVLEQVIDSLKAGGVDFVVAIVAPHLPELIPLAERRGAWPLLLPNDTPDMQATVEYGLRFVEQRYSPDPADAWLLAPADHPLLEPEIVRQLVEARRHQTAYSIFVPVYGGRRGHPALLSWTHASKLQDYPPARGLNQYIRDHESQVLEVPVQSKGILADLDTPQDYERLRSSGPHRPTSPQ
jgi:molybdenum cofactor cytidylyltransferase